ncbi:MAG TPA: 3-hydroxyacyl-CoA dehydrogenase, partial [Armatimonadota bacterium]
NTESISGGKTKISRLFVLDLSGGSIFSMNPDDSDRKVIVTGYRYPDGMAVIARSSDRLQF